MTVWSFNSAEECERDFGRILNDPAPVIAVNSNGGVAEWGPASTHSPCFLHNQQLHFADGVPSGMSGVAASSVWRQCDTAPQTDNVEMGHLDPGSENGGWSGDIYQLCKCNDGSQADYCRTDEDCQSNLHCDY